MPLRITPMHPIERNGLKGFGLRVFIDNHQFPSDGGAFVAVKAQGRLTNANGVEPSPSVTHPNSSALSSRRDDRTGEDAVSSPSSPVTLSTKNEEV